MPSVADARNTGLYFEKTFAVDEHMTKKLGQLSQHRREVMTHAQAAEAGLEPIQETAPGRVLVERTIKHPRYSETDITARVYRRADNSLVAEETFRAGVRADTREKTAELRDQCREQADQWIEEILRREKENAVVHDNAS